MSKLAMKRWLVFAGLYNILWGAWVVLLPYSFFSLTGMKTPTYIEFWQCIGMIVGVYGIGYLIASTNPILHWPITLVGFLGKVFGPIGFFSSVSTGKIPIEFGYTILTNDLIWWYPFGYILWKSKDEIKVTLNKLFKVQSTP